MKKKTIKYRKGGYVTIEKSDVLGKGALTFLSMDGKGFYNMFVKNKK